MNGNFDFLRGDQSLNKDFFVGTSGWNYPHWGKGVFYPPWVKQEDWLSYYARFFNTVEINNTFYRMPAKNVFKRWESQVPEHFRFAVKVSRFVTHMKKLNHPEQSLSKFLENVAMLKQKVTLLLFQLPPFFKINLIRLASLLDFLKQQTILPGIKVVFEFRNRTWLNEGTFNLLEDEGAGLCFADWPEVMVEGPVTSHFIYLRKHGSRNAYTSEYSTEQIAEDARRIRVWLKEGREVYCYFNNDAQGFAVKNALTLSEMIKS